MAQLIIRGGRKLTGELALTGAKNSSFKLMIVSLLASGPVTLTNVSRISETNKAAEMIRALGGRVSWIAKHEVEIDPTGINQTEILPKFGSHSRASTLFLGPLLARFGRAVVPYPGGDAIGRRPLDRHLSGLTCLGAKFKLSDALIEARGRLKGGKIAFKKNSHTATETIIMAAVLAPGKTEIIHPAQEPEVNDLIAFLVQMGARIRRLPDRLVIEGVKQLRPVKYAVMPDRNQAVSFAVAALATGGEVTINQVRPDHLSAFIEKIREAGAGVETSRQSIRFFTLKPLKAVSIITAPHPGFMTDWQPLWSVLMTQAQGQSQIVETIFTQRFQFVPDLKVMGAKIRYFDPKPADPENFYNFNLDDDQTDYHHGILITGPARLKAGEFSVKDIRNGATLAIAGLIARGKTRLNQAELIDRGYEDFAGSLTRLGAQIDRLD